MKQLFFLCTIVVLLSGCSTPSNESTKTSRQDFTNDEKMNIHLCLMGGGENCAEIKNPGNKSIYADAIKEQCELMPGMKECNDYFGLMTAKALAGEQYDTTPNS
jgi:hypothetical protein